MAQTLAQSIEEDVMKMDTRTAKSNIAKQFKFNPDTMDKADLANRTSAYKEAKKDYYGKQLNQAKKDSAFATSPMGVAKQIPAAVVDTTKRIAGDVVNYAKRLNPIPKGGFSPHK